MLPVARLDVDVVTDRLVDELDELDVVRVVEEELECEEEGVSVLLMRRLVETELSVLEALLVIDVVSCSRGSGEAVINLQFGGWFHVGSAKVGSESQRNSAVMRLLALEIFIFLRVSIAKEWMAKYLPEIQ